MSIILLASDRKCYCDHGTKCVLGRCGFKDRCTEEELKNFGYTTIVAFDENSDKIVRGIQIIGSRIWKTKNNKIRIK